LKPGTNDRQRRPAALEYKVPANLRFKLIAQREDL